MNGNLIKLMEVKINFSILIIYMMKIYNIKCKYWIYNYNLLYINKPVFRLLKDIKLEKEILL